MDFIARFEDLRRTIEPVRLNASDEAVLDVRCTTLQPVRASNFAIVCYGAYHGNGEGLFDDKIFTGHVVNLTLRGRWHVFGRQGVHELGAGIAMLGCSGDSYGCRHSLSERNVNLIVALRPESIDPDEPRLFGRDCIRADGLPSRILRALDAQNNDAFESLLFEFVHEVSRSSQPHGRKRGGTTLRMQGVKRFIERHAFEQIRIADIAASAHLYPFALIRDFRRAFGITPHAYLNQCRISEAMRLLRHTKVTMDDVAARTGFQDAAYFSRAFRRATGMTPSMFRNG